MVGFEEFHEIAFFGFQRNPGIELRATFSRPFPRGSFRPCFGVDSGNRSARYAAFWRVTFKLGLRLSQDRGVDPLFAHPDRVLCASYDAFRGPSFGLV